MGGARRQRLPDMSDSRSPCAKRSLTGCRSAAVGWSARPTPLEGPSRRCSRTADGRPVEAVLMRYRDGRRSICLSSQSGCPLTCTFCATGQMKFGRNLTASEILDQALHFRRASEVDHAVFMGMGEPMMNLETCRSVQRLPDIGIGAPPHRDLDDRVDPGIQLLPPTPMPIRLALSLHAADEGARTRADARQRALPAPRRDRGVRAPTTNEAPQGVRRVRDARRRQRPFRAGGHSSRASLDPRDVQGQPDPVQPNRVGGHRARAPRRSRVPRRTRAPRRRTPPSASPAAATSTPRAGSWAGALVHCGAGAAEPERGPEARPP